jgi:serine/threonine protein kinase
MKLILCLKKKYLEENNSEYKTLNCLADLLEKCLMIDPLKRMDVEEALVHPFFEK